MEGGGQNDPDYPKDGITAENIRFNTTPAAAQNGGEHPISSKNKKHTAFENAIKNAGILTDGDLFFGFVLSPGPDADRFCERCQVAWGLNSTRTL